MFLSEYKLFIYFFVLSMIFMGILFGMSFFFVYQKPTMEKNSSYECGFNAFLDASMQFDVSFYIVGLLFLIFDLELIFLFPWSVVFWQLFSEGFLAMIFFLFLLILGFVYEILHGCLDWH